MSQLKKPDLNPGPLKVLNDALHQLRLEAGEPSLPRIAEVWGAGHVDRPRRYRTSRSKSGVGDMFSSGDVPNGEALNDLVAVLAMEFMHLDEGQASIKQREFRLLRSKAAAHVPGRARSDFGAQLHQMGTEYLRLADLVQHAENIAATSMVPMTRYHAYDHAAAVARSFLGDHPVVQELSKRADEVAALDWNGTMTEPAPAWTSRARVDPAAG